MAKQSDEHVLRDVLRPRSIAATETQREVEHQIAMHSVHAGDEIGHRKVRRKSRRSVTRGLGIGGDEPDAGLHDHPQTHPSIAPAAKRNGGRLQMSCESATWSHATPPTPNASPSPTVNPETTRTFAHNGTSS